MMVEPNRDTGKSRWRKFAFSMLVGGIAGFVLFFGLSYLITSDVFGDLPKSAGTALMVGSFFLLMAAGVGIGALTPSIGSAFLNVEDREELLEQRQMLIASAASMTLWGVALIVLSLAAPDGPIPVTVAAVISLAAMLIGGLFTWRSYRVSDEMMLAINREGTALAFLLVFLVIGGWAIAEHLGFVGSMTPLDILTLFYVLTLAASMIVTGRRGLLKPK